MNRLGRAAYWSIPSLLCLAIYWFGLKVWFLQDDFAWLGLRQLLDREHNFWHVMFAPMAQGTIRPWSERGFFLLFYSLFGLEALPFRIWVFLTQFANLVLLSSIAWRITRSRAVGFLAPILWMVHCSLSAAMSWTSSYNQVLCSFFLLAAFRLFLSYVDTGDRRYYVAQWLVFLLGFGALELNVVYPALVFSYSLFFARKYLRSTLPLFAASVAFIWIHHQFAPGVKTGVYAMHWDVRIFLTLGTYWEWAMGPQRLQDIGYGPDWAVLAATCVLLAAFWGFAVWKTYRRDWLAAFCVSWFVIVLSPLLPLRDHISDYYLTIPMIGLAILGAAAMVDAWNSGVAARAGVLLLVTVYVATNVTVSQAQTRWNFDRSRGLRNLMRGVERAHELHPEKIILLKGVRGDLFWSGFADSPFRLLGISKVYLVPGSEEQIEAHPELGEPKEFVLPAAVAFSALKNGEAVVYEASTERLQNITGFYSKLALSTWKPGLPQMVDAGEPLYSDQFGEGWFGIENGYRWMTQRAQIRLGGPSAAGMKLHLSGFAPEQLFHQGAVHLTVRVDGQQATVATLEARDTQVDVEVIVPERSVGKAEIKVELETDRVYVPPGDGRRLSLAFGKIRIQ